MDKKLFITDDDEDDCELFATIAEDIDAAIDVVAIKTRQELLTKLSSEKPWLLFVDSNIGGDDGAEVIEKLKSEDQFKNLPVIMYTGSVNNKTIEKAFAAGADAYIVKPHSLTELRKVLQALFSVEWSTNTAKLCYIDGAFKEYR